MSETIDALKTKLAPDNLIAEAKTGAHEAVKGAMEGAGEATKDVAANIAAAASHLGEQASTTAANIGTAVKQAVADTGENMKQATENVKENVKHAAENTVSTAKDAGYRVADTIRNNPLPVALVGGTLIYLYLNSKRDRIPDYRPADDNNHGYPAPSNSTGYNPAAYRPTTGTLTGTASNGSSSDSPLSQARDKMDEIAGNVKSKVMDTTHNIGERVADVKNTVGERVTDVRNTVGDQAQKQVERAKTLLDEKPLLVGAAVLALGAAIGLLIPPTDAENKWIGPSRDRLVDQANEKVGDIAHKAGIVAQKTLDSIHENTREVLTTAKESAREAIDTVKNAASDAYQEVRQDASADAPEKMLSAT